MKAQSAGRQQARTHSTTSGMLLAFAAAPLALADGAARTLGDAPGWKQATVAASAAALLLAALFIIPAPRFGRIAATLGLAGSLALGVPELLDSPFVALAASIVCGTALASIWGLLRPLAGTNRIQRRPVHEGRAKGAGVVALSLWGAYTWLAPDPSWGDTLTLGWAFASSSLLAAHWALRNLSVHRLRAVAVLVAVAGAMVLAALDASSAWSLVNWFAIAAFAAVVCIRPVRRSSVEPAGWWEPLLNRPERLLVGTFAALCAGGSLLLALPRSAASGEGLSFVDALFTSTSAACVTGLVVLDTPVDFSAFGQAVILLLIQLGGLGIMTFSTAALWVLGRRMSLRHERVVASLVSVQDRGRLFTTIKRILWLTAIAEGLGAIALTAAFVAHGDDFGRALWRGVFTSISAFCNAGFALQSDSLIPFQHSPFVLHVVGALVVLGGLSPLAVFALPAIARRSTLPIPVQARLGLAATGVLLIGGFAWILAFEWSASLAGLSFADRLHNAWFQSVTLRTAGFNSVDVSLAHPATLTLMLLWMFIGGNPGGAAGGVKTTTISVLVLSVVQAIRGHWALELMGRRISERTRAKAAVTVTIAALTCIVAVLAIQLTQRMPTPVAVFEVVSALGTVGLSIGGTSQLDSIGKLIISICMFVGRVGGLTLLMLLSNRFTPSAISRPEEDIDVG